MLDDWAREWNIPPAALYALKVRMGAVSDAFAPAEGGKSEAAVQNDIRLAAAQMPGLRLWRNNVGALRDERGVPVRYGLANDSAQVNKVVKSGDLVGIEPVRITHAHVGQVIGRFLSLECKTPGFVYNPRDAHLAAQMTWANMVNAAGGRACFATGPDALKP